MIRLTLGLSAFKPGLYNRLPIDPNEPKLDQFDAPLLVIFLSSVVRYLRPDNSWLILKSKLPLYKSELTDIVYSPPDHLFELIGKYAEPDDQALHDRIIATQPWFRALCGKYQR